MLQPTRWQRIGHKLVIELQQCTHQVYVKTTETKIISNREKKSRSHFTYEIMMYSHEQAQRDAKIQDIHKLQKLIIIKKSAPKLSLKNLTSFRISRLLLFFLT